MQQVSTPSPAVRDYIFRSEAATMLFLRSQTHVPVPKVFGWAAESDADNDVGVGYILMEKLEGKPPDWEKLTAQWKEKVMQQLADVFLEIEAQAFGKIGSLMLSGQEEIFLAFQGLTCSSIFEYGRPWGPFDSSIAAAHIIVESYLDRIVNGEMGIGELDNVYFAHRFRLDIFHEIWDGRQEGQQEEFYLKHPDDKDDHILVDDSLNIVSIVDWE
ncbi:hypothetical protein VTI74DRAFT_7869 [Chaetomium olivicolor]